MAAAAESADVIIEKKGTRKVVKALLKAASPDDLAQQSQRICAQLLALPGYTAATRVVSYLTCAALREVDTDAVNTHALAHSKTLFVPVVEDKASNMSMLHLDSMEGITEVPPFGIREPTRHYASGDKRLELARDGIVPDFIVLPGLAFDRTGRRLGRGGGYYDKFVAGVLERAKAQGVPRPALVGMCFQQQVVDYVPTTPTDERVDLLVLPDEVVDCGNSPA